MSLKIWWTFFHLKKKKNIKILKNNNECVYEKGNSYKVFLIVNNEKIIIFSSIYKSKDKDKDYNQLKIYGTNDYKLQSQFIFDNPLNDFTFYNLEKNLL